jgi:ankyrin repeat protein
MENNRSNDDAPKRTPNEGDNQAAAKRVREAATTAAISSLSSASSSSAAATPSPPATAMKGTPRGGGVKRAYSAVASDGGVARPSKAQCVPTGGADHNLGSYTSTQSQMRAATLITAALNTTAKTSSTPQNVDEVTASDAGLLDQLMQAIVRNDSSSISSLVEHCAQHHPGRLKVLLQMKGAHGSTAVYMAAKHRNIPALRILISHGADVNSSNSNGITPLYIAGHYGSIEAVDILCAAGANVEHAKEDGATVAYSACKHGHLEVVKRLVHYGARARSCRKRNGMTLLHVAAQNGHVELVRYLIDKLGSDLDDRTETGGTPLHLACFQNRIKVVELLIARGTDVDTRDDAGWTALHIATQIGSIEVVEAVLKAPCRRSFALASEQANPGAISAAGARRNPAAAPVVAAELANGPNGDNAPAGAVTYPVDPPGAPEHVRDEAHDDDEFVAATPQVIKQRLARTKDDGYPALMVSCRTGRSLNMTEFLINAGADVNQELADASTPFLIAAKHGRLDHIEMFLRLPDAQRKVIVGQTSSFGWNALHWAARGGFVLMVRALLKAKLFSIDAAVNSGMTALYIASHHGHLAVVEALVDAGASINQAMANGASPLYSACKHGQLDVVRFLLKRGALLRITNTRGSSPLHTACNHNRLEVVKYLVNEAGADPNTTKGQEGWRALHIACRVGAMDIVRFLVEEAKVDINIRTEDFGGMMGGFTALHLAASHGCKEIVRYLVGEAGAPVDPESSTGLTPRHLATRRNRHDVSLWLKRAKHWTPLMFAVDARSLPRVKALLRGPDAVAKLRHRTELGDDALSLSLSVPATQAKLVADKVEALRLARADQAGDATAGMQGTPESANEAENGNENENENGNGPAQDPWLPFDEEVYKTLMLAHEPYSMWNHRLQPEEVRRLGHLVLLATHRIRHVPNEMWYHVLEYCGREY